MALSEAQIVELTRRYQRSLANISAVSEQRLQAIWDHLGSWDDTDVDRFLAHSTPAVQAAHKAASALTSGYLALLLGTAAAAIVRLDEPPDFRSPFIGYWAALKRGDRWDQAITVGRTRAGTIGLDAAQTAARDTAQQVDSREPRIVGWERVLTGTSCEFCATVATQRYHTAESASFGHDRCDCTVVPIIGSSAPGRVINRDLLATLKTTGDEATGYVTPDGQPAPRPDAAPVAVP